MFLFEKQAGCVWWRVVLPDDAAERSKDRARPRGVPKEHELRRL